MDDTKTKTLLGMCGLFKYRSSGIIQRTKIFVADLNRRNKKHELFLATNN